MLQDFERWNILRSRRATHSIKSEKRTIIQPKISQERLLELRTEWYGHMIKYGRRQDL